MKRLLFISLLLLLSCSKSEGIIGTWTVEKISFDFDERKSTPEMIRQLGLIEKHNTLIFKNDSIVHITMAAMDSDYKYTLNPEGTISLEPDTHHITHFSLKNSVITTETDTPIGKMIIKYKK